MAPFFVSPFTFHLIDNNQKFILFIFNLISTHKFTHAFCLRCKIQKKKKKTCGGFPSQPNNKKILPNAQLKCTNTQCKFDQQQKNTHHLPPNANKTTHGLMGHRHLIIHKDQHVIRKLHRIQAQISVQQIQLHLRTVFSIGLELMMMTHLVAIRLLLHNR